MDNHRLSLWCWINEIDKSVLKVFNKVFDLKIKIPLE